ncbi:hypothetical protein ACJOMK_04340, partial [Mycoplasmopsis synoviae]
SSAAVAASATVRVATGTEEAAQAPQAPATPDLASTVCYLKTLETELKTQSEALNGDTTTNKTAYYKPVKGRTLYWEGFMPKIVVERYQPDGYVADGQANNRAAHEDAN